MGTLSPNKGYTIPTVSADNNTWGAEINGDLTTIDLNLGGVASVAVGGNTNVTASAAQAQNLVQKLTGTLTGNISYLLPAASGFYIINNATSGAFSITVITTAGGSTGVVAPQSATIMVWSDATNIYTVATTATGMLGEVRSVSVPEALLPSGWHVCAGQTRPRTDPLWLATGAVNAAYWVWGNGDGSTTYTMPDFRGRALFGKDDMNGSAANRLTNAVSGVTGTTLGAAGGDQHAQQDTITASSVVTDTGHSHGLPVTLFTGAGVFAGSINSPSGTTPFTATTSATTGITVATTATSTLTGASQNIPPAAVVNQIIYCGA